MENNNVELLANMIFNLLPKCKQKEEMLAEKNGLRHSEYKCLEAFEPGIKISNSVVAKRMNVSPSRTSRIIDDLVKKKYLLREEFSEDRRSINLSLSESGEILRNELRKEYVKLHKEILKSLNPSDQQSLIVALRVLNSAIEDWLNKPGITFSERKRSTVSSME